MSGLFEQAPAQDDREAFEAHLKKDGIAEEFLEREEEFTERYSWVAIQDAWEIWQAAIATRPAQTEQQPELVMPVALGSVNADYDKGWADHASEVRRLNAELLPSTPC